MGKISILTELEATIKQNYPHLWVIQINLSDYIKVLPVTSENQMDFLTKCWIFNLKLNSTSKSKCKQYSKALNIKMLSMRKLYHHDNSVIPI